MNCTNSQKVGMVFILFPLSLLTASGVPKLFRAEKKSAPKRAVAARRYAFTMSLPYFLANTHRPSYLT